MCCAMTVQAPIGAARQRGLGVSSRGRFVQWPWSWRWESVVAVVAVVSALAAFWITVNAKFLAYPDWLAVQKADLILGPVFVGLYWRHRRPNNRVGLLLIVLGLVGVPYILSSLTDPTLFMIGVAAECPIYFMTTAVILAFPSGRIEGVAAKVILAVSVISNVLVTTLYLLVEPQYGPGFSISGCRTACPTNPFAILSTPAWLPTVNNVYGALLIAIPIATAGVVVWRFIAGTPPRRRALAIGAPIALLFLSMQASYRTVFFLSPDGLALSQAPVHSGLQWTFAAARSFLWYGFLFALIAAELFAGRTLRRLVGDSLGRPSLEQLEAMVRVPLGDPGLRLGFWRPRLQGWADADDEVLEPPGPGQTLTPVKHEGRPSIAIVHDSQLSEDPELLQAAGAVALLALENADLDAAWKESLDELADSRARLVSVGARERRKLERDLHDGAQQRLVAATINLSLAGELADGNPELRERVSEAGAEVEGALAELRELAHGIYPQALGRWGLARAFDVLAARYPGRVNVIAATSARFPAEVEAAMYYCCTEAVQNASKHAGADTPVAIRLYAKADRLHLEVRDDGPGFDVTATYEGVGLENMRDRLGAVRGTVEIVSQPGHGTLVAATAPVQRPTERRAAHAARAGGSRVDPRPAAGSGRSSTARAMSPAPGPPRA
jgi:signal transduction histidine kinase